MADEMEWKTRHKIIVTTVFPSLNLCGAKVNSAFDLCEIGELSSGVINAVQVSGVVQIIRELPGKLLRQQVENSRGWYIQRSRTIMHNSHDSLQCCNLKLDLSVKFQLYIEIINKNYKYLEKSTFYRRI